MGLFSDNFQRLPLVLLSVLSNAVVHLSSCSITPQENYTALAVDERQLAKQWPDQEGAKQTTSISELINSPELDALIAEALTAKPVYSRHF